ncbi:MFS transporter [Legionella israelensis]|uniref:Major facilitator superfamily (MFS) transporter n=1 Tax=Legionella israelensis TaxID=454 RepID=A0A0W0WMS7_9GAMM|nr:MFS transporter [Legionella israelensis]KTD33612.1 major facilitator superfamily (MFS) transporter [Legionella israelensis]QBS08804.1 MFS transporter [Legionella israelensis]SCY12758.1 Predicted arabinose efflux permease, MFS family [Legionella israelensis DSM 19235]STX58484.1 major facilitator superfamily (MFS) transporter [Legionella israelensis]
MVSNFKVVWLLSYISVASVSSAIITPALPQIQSEFALGNGEVEWMVSAFLIGYVLGQLIYGPLANAYGRLKALRIGLIINILGILLCFMALSIHSYVFLIFGRFITALGAAGGLACTFMLINEWLPEAKRKMAMAYSILSFTIGIGLSVMIGGLVTQYWHWSGCFWILLFQGILMLWGTKAFSETLTHPQPINFSMIFTGYKKALSSGQLLIFSLAWGYCSSVSYCFSAAAPQIAVHSLGLTAAEYGYWNILNIAGMFAGGLQAKALLDRYSPRQVITMGLVGCAVGLLSLIFLLQLNHPSALWFFLSTASLFFFSGSLYAGGSFVASTSIEDRASGAAMMSFINMSTATLTVIIMGYLSANALLSFISILVLLGGLTTVLLVYENLVLRKAHAGKH